MRYASITATFWRSLGLIAWVAASSACDTLSTSSPDASTGGAHEQADSGEGSATGELPLPTTSGGRLDLSGGAWRLIDVPAASNQPSIVRTPDGWLALSSRVFGGKAITGAESVLYRSSDGVTWDRVAFDGGDNLELRSLAYGNGDYVMMGRRLGDGVVWTSDDAMTWSESSQAVDSVEQVGSVTFVGDRFLAFGFRVVAGSEDGRSWERATVDLLQMMGVAHGNGRFLATGSGPVITSQDGSHWQSQMLDCSVPNTCITDPSGGSHEAILASVLFAEGKFFAGQLSSPDGAAWSAVSEPAADAYVEGHFFALDESGISTWTTGGSTETIEYVRPSKAAVTAAGRQSTSIGVFDFDAPLPDQVSTAFDDGLTCLTSRCLLIDGRLLLVPPPGTPALPDRVPRNADGEPLLSDDCPVSRMIFCDDYEKRTGCSCRPDAPQAPAACDDVSQFSCEGKFVARAEEWQIDEVAEGGCACDAIDPNQPLSFGISCDSEANGMPRPGQSICKAPLSCLAIQAPVSNGGPPGPQPFVCTAACAADADCPSWEATGFCAGHVMLSCVEGTCQPRACE